MNSFLTLLVNQIVDTLFEDAPGIENLGDIFIGGNRGDLLIGGDNDDLFLSGKGNDTVIGGAGTDVVFAGNGRDVVIGQTGDDIAFLGSGDDRFIWNNGDGSDFINGGQGYDTTQVNGASGPGDEFQLTQEKGQAIFDRLNLGLFTLTNESIEQFEINGKGGDDSLFVGDLSETDVRKVIFSGRFGNDTLDARESSTTIKAIGGRGSDLLLGGSAQDLFIGGIGNDTVVGQRGDDSARLGAGDDLFVWNNGDGSDLINGGSGYDTTQVNGADGPGDEFELSQNRGQALFDRLNLGLFTLTNKRIERFEINGQGGNDSLSVGDLSQTDVQTVVFSGGEGNDVLDARESSTTIEAYGGEGDDLLLGGSAVDTFYAGAGDDIVVGQRGDDQAYLEDGDDRFVWNNGDGSDFINGGTGFDVTQVNGADGPGDAFDLRQVDGQAIFNRFNLGLFTLTNEEIEQFEINGQGGDDSLTVGELAGSGIQSVVFSGGEGNDVLDASETETSILADGGAGDDLLIGGSGDDLLIGGDGSNLLIGGGGNDTLVGGNGANDFGFDTGAVFDADDIGMSLIQDFGADDRLVLDMTVFSQLNGAVGGSLSSDEFAVVNSVEEAALSDALIVYGATSGNLYYNPNGNAEGFGQGAQFATIEGAPALTADDFVLQA